MTLLWWTSCMQKSLWKMDQTSEGLSNKSCCNVVNLQSFKLYFFLMLLLRLQVIADQLVEHFVSVGLMIREWDRVKLHGTLMNTLFRRDSAGKDITRCVSVLCKKNKQMTEKKKKVIDWLWSCWELLPWSCLPVHLIISWLRPMLQWRQSWKLNNYNHKFLNIGMRQLV